MNKRVKEWFKDKHNITFIAILIAAFAIRLYYFYLTKNQALWWDEAEYALRAKAFAFGTPLSGWAPEREVIVPFLFSLILAIGGNEIVLRIIQVLVSTGTVAMTYLLISKMSNKNYGLVATFGMAFFWLHIFFTERVLLYLWAPLLFLVIVYFFYTGYVKEESRAKLIWFGIFSAVGLSTYFSIGFLLAGILVYVIASEGFSALKSRKVWTSLGVFFLALLPHMIYSQITYGFPIPRLAVGYQATTGESGAGLSGLLAYVNMFPSRVGMIFSVLCLLGILYFLFNLALGFGIKGHLKKNSEWFLLFIAFFVPFALYTLYGVVGGSATFYDAFILPVFPFAFAFAGLSVVKIYEWFAKYNKVVVGLFIFILMVFQAYYGISNSDDTIKAKISSYDSVKEAGIWINEHTEKGDVVISRSRPQNTYYSERETYGYPENESDMTKLIEEKKPKFIIDSVWESRMPWADLYFYENNNTLVPVMAYFLDKEKKQPSLIIYEARY